MSDFLKRHPRPWKDDRAWIFDASDNPVAIIPNDEVRLAILSAVNAYEPPKRKTKAIKPKSRKQ